MELDVAALATGGLAFAILAVCATPLAATIFFAALIALFANPAPLPPDFLVSYSLAMRLNSPALISIPLFALAGELAVAAGISDRLLMLADALAGGGRHRLARQTMIGATLFASVSSVGPAAVAELGKKHMPAMLRAGYKPGIAAGMLAAAAGVALVIPASIPQTIFAAATGLQTNIIFTACFVPGIILPALLFIALVARDKLVFFQEQPGVAAEYQVRTALRRAGWSLLLPLLVLSSLFSGFFTAPEAAAFASAYSALIGFFRHRTLTRHAVWQSLVRAGVTAAAILLLAGVAGLGIQLLNSAGYLDALAGLLHRAAGGRAMVIVLLNIILLAAGLVLDTPAIITMIAPLFLPLAAKLGISLPQFGAMVVVNIAIGFVTPPQAYNLTAAAEAAGTDVRTAAHGSAVFLLAMLALLLAVSFIPQISLWLPAVFGWLE
ncbi:MAG: TRAP transporter large permease subunit [Planctomycetes bacterium]|nr:TRAP transporter large permease subunit [Planctomycetota bacterium]